MLIGGRYETIELLGTGGMGEVYLALDSVSGQHVALKLLKDQVSQDIVIRFDRECALLARMSHPAVVRVLDRGTSEGRVYYAMEHVPWPTLTQRITERYKAGKPFAASEVLAVLQGLAPALDHLHALDVVHRDIKPSNLLVSDAFEVRVIDFGLAGMLADRMTRTGAILGSMLYLSPEQVRADKSLDKRSDVFQTGLVLHEMLTGRKAYSDVMAYVRALRSSSPPLQSPRDVDPRVPEPVSRIVMRALAVAPEERPASVGDLCKLFAEAVSARDPAPVEERPLERPRQQSRMARKPPSASLQAVPQAARVPQPAGTAAPSVRAPAALALVAFASLLVLAGYGWHRTFSRLPPVPGLEVTHGFFRTEMRWSTAEAVDSSVQLSRKGEATREHAASAGRSHVVSLQDLEPGATYRAEILVGGRPAGQPLVLQAPTAPAVLALTASITAEGTTVNFQTPVATAATVRWTGPSGETGSAESSGGFTESHRLSLARFLPNAPFRLDFRLVSRLGETWSTRVERVPAR
ncbi:MAG: protein kinase [Candidatus Wallbacteria bacterium]|nr:protein kinase [Candidatus Wallbacteria bacterium]